MTTGQDMLKAGFARSLDPMLQQLRARGAPAAMITELQEATDQWFNTEIKWEELQPRLVELYVDAYTETELQEILGFIKTPTGQKMIKNNATLMQRGMAIGQQYAMSKAATLQAKIQEISAKYQPAPALPAPTDPTAPSPSTPQTP